MCADPATIAMNLERVRERVARAAERSGRMPHQIVLVAVTKTFPAEVIREAYTVGLRHFGENRVQEWEQKQPQVADLNAVWHLVGHLQSNKARRAARLFRAIDSVDSIALATRLDAAAAELTGRLPVLVEVQVAAEPAKAGVTEGDLTRLAEAILSLQHLELRGLMAIPPFFDDPEQARPYFRKLRALRDTLLSQLGDAARLSELSMGMSHDFEIAIEEGATQVRLGTALFGPR